MLGESKEEGDLMRAILTLKRVGEETKRKRKGRKLQNAL